MYNAFGGLPQATRQTRYLDLGPIFLKVGGNSGHLGDGHLGDGQLGDKIFIYYYTDTISVVIRQKNLYVPFLFFIFQFFIFYFSGHLGDGH